MKERVLYLDFLRCLAIFLVIILHSNAPVLVNPDFYQLPSWYLCMLLDPLNRTGVPLFFMISGYLLLSRTSTKDLCKFYKHNIPKLLIPLFAWNIIYFWARTQIFHVEINFKSFVEALLNQGISYHMWFIYTMLAIYIFCPFLKRMVDGCSQTQLFFLICIILFPTAILPLVAPHLPIEIGLFNLFSLGELQARVGYFLLGYLLGNWDMKKGGRYSVYILGLASYVACLYGNLSTSSSEEITLPFESGTAIFQYFIAASTYLFVKTLFSKHSTHTSAGRSVLSWLSKRAYGVYWVHVLVLDVVTMIIGSSMPIVYFIGYRIGFTTVISLIFAVGVSYIPVIRRILQY